MRERIGKLEVETGNIAQMVAELLDLARIESGGRQLHLDDVDLAKVATESVERLRPFAERQGVELRVDIDGALPPVRGEAARLAQVFANLVHNAIKFSPSGKEVRIGVKREPAGCSRAGSPTTARVSPGDLGRIFERFYKADRTRRPAAGPASASRSRGTSSRATGA